MRRLGFRVEELARDADCPRAAQLCAVLQVVLAPVLAGQEEPTGEFRAIVDDFMRELRAVAATAPSGPPRPTASRPERQTVLVAFGLPPEQVTDLSERLHPFGYVLTASTDAGELMEQVRRRPEPAAVLLGMKACGSAREGRGLVERLRVAAGGTLPVIGISPVDDLAQRMLASQCGMDALLSQPLDFYGLMDRLDALLRFRDGDRLKVLVVPGGPSQAAYFTGVLEGAGMLVTTVEDPGALLESLDEASPDLLLIDADLPGIDGPSLAGAIRQIPRYSALSIVLMGQRPDPLDHGGDDFLLKPVSPRELVRAVTARAARSRGMQALTGTDPLTGLLNQTRIKEELAKELARAARRRARLAVAMIDIDGFKSVNDTYGHPVGDQVIRSLARLLVQRMRSSDHIGRYGGEEFVIVMPDADLQDARRTVEEVRERFAAMMHATPRGDFRVTFSAGIAGYPDIARPLRLVLAADRALYAAKRAGRDRTVVARVGQAAA